MDFLNHLTTSILCKANTTVILKKKDVGLVYRDEPMSPGISTLKKSVPHKS